MTTPIRKWRFTAGHTSTSILKNDVTDLWGEWSVDGDPGVLSYTIHAQYDLRRNLTTETNVFLRRKSIEDRMKLLMKYKGREGILDIDWDLGLGRPEQLVDVTFESLSPIQIDNNQLLEYDLKFIYASPGTLLRSWSFIKMNPLPTEGADYKGEWDSGIEYHFGDLITRSGGYFKALRISVSPHVEVDGHDTQDPLYPPDPEPAAGFFWQPYQSDYKGEWSTGTHYLAGQIVTRLGVTYKAKQANFSQPPVVNAIWGINGVAVPALDNSWFVVDWERADRTLWKTVARGADIRVRSSPAMDVITLIGIRQKVYAAADTELSRRLASEALVKSLVLLKGEELYITLDGVFFGVCALTEVKKSKIDLPDAITFDLVFNKGYVNG